VSFTGESGADEVLASNGTQPVALASGDIDRNGTPDVVIGYANGDAGILTIQRGNPDAYAPADDSTVVRMQQGYDPESMLAEAEVYPLPVSPDFVAVGSFRQGGSKSILFGARGGGLYFMAGDGNGSFEAPEQLPLPGGVTALKTGEFRSADGVQ